MSRRQARWLDFLAKFDLNIQHIPRKSNVADHFSRMPGVQLPQVDTGSTLGILHTTDVQSSAVRHRDTFANNKGHSLALVRSFEPHSYAYHNLVPCVNPTHVRC